MEAFFFWEESSSFITFAEFGVSFGINIVRKTVTGVSCIFIQDIITGSNVEKDSRLRFVW